MSFPCKEELIVLEDFAMPVVNMLRHRFQSRIVVFGVVFMVGIISEGLTEAIGANFSYHWVFDAFIFAFIATPFVYHIFVKALLRCVVDLELTREQMLVEQNKLRELVEEDPLTGLGNRRKLHEAFGAVVSVSRRMNNGAAVLLIDVDNFKMFNDTWGHTKGDQCLKQIGSILRSCTREHDIACRYGGEEFIVVLAAVSKEVAIRRADEIRDYVSRTASASVGLDPLKITCSIGCAWTSQPKGKHLQELIDRADVALYNAKRSGKDQVIEG